MVVNKQRHLPGLVVAAATAVVSGVAVAINGYGVRAWADVGGPSAYTTAKNVVAAFILVVVASLMAARTTSSRRRSLAGWRQWAGLGAVAVVGGSVPFLLFFEGLALATSANAAFIHKLLIVFVAALAVPFLGERIRSWHVLAIAVLIWGQAMLAGGVADFSGGRGELMILAATVMWSIEVIVAKRLLRDLSPMTMAVARMGGGSMILVAYGWATGAFSALGQLGGFQLRWALLTGAVLSLYVAGWYMSLSRAPAIDVMAVLVGGAVITALIQTGWQGAALPSPLGLVAIAAGVAIILWRQWRAPLPR